MATVRAPHLYRSLRCFCLGAFHVLSAEDVDLPFAFEQHASRGRPVLYEYRPLVRDFVEARARKLEGRQDAQLAVQDLRAEPAAGLFGEEPFKSVLLPLILRVSESCGGFDWDDAAFDRAYEELEQTLFSGRRAYAAVAPLIGLSLGGELALAEGLSVRHAATGELAKHWPEAQALLPPEFGRDTDRLCVIELQRELAAGETAPDAAGEISDAVTAVRLATSGAIAAGPVLFERVDWRPFGIKPMLPIAAAQPGGEATRLDPFRGRLASELLERLPLADEDPELGEALDRWELSLFQSGPVSRGAAARGADGVARRDGRRVGGDDAGVGAARRPARRAAAGHGAPRDRRDAHARRSTRARARARRRDARAARGSRGVLRPRHRLTR